MFSFKTCILMLFFFLLLLLCLLIVFVFPFFILKQNINYSFTETGWFVLNFCIQILNDDESRVCVCNILLWISVHADDEITVQLHPGCNSEYLGAENTRWFASWWPFLQFNNDVLVCFRNNEIVDIMRYV